MNNRIDKIIGKVKFNNETVVITDPCYLLHTSSTYSERLDTVNGVKYEDVWREVAGYGDTLDRLGIKRFVVANTLYGDWSCTVYNRDEVNDLLAKKIDDVTTVYGEFCADSGLVIVLPLEEVLLFNPNWMEWHNSHTWCSTLIPNFTGYVSIVYGLRERLDDEDDEEDDEDIELDNNDQECWIEGYGSVNFIGFQTGL